MYMNYCYCTICILAKWRALEEGSRSARTYLYMRVHAENNVESGKFRSCSHGALDRENKVAVVSIGLWIVLQILVVIICFASLFLPL
ncbi:hypothetical protein RRG08_027542 [Elysia crispata]|uniref:Uncharacterized protein n=1 Tax=Elysia crispata TaxID=231223 RepID=A0AAE1BBV9_9GAST|nr:hypothetical protein RRG08_027542 [Elysia crispata]